MFSSIIGSNIKMSDFFLNLKKKLSLNFYTALSCLMLIISVDNYGSIFWSCNNYNLM